MMHEITQKSSLEITTRVSLEGLYRARVRGIESTLEFYPDFTGCIRGWFSADGETLSIFGGVPSAFGEVYGCICVPESGETLAVFRAIPSANGIAFDVDAPDEHDLMKLANAESFEFERVI
jgi:hypothetical protein